MTKSLEFLNTTGFPFLKDFLEEMFYSLGIWDLNAGQSQYGYLGARFTNLFGSDSRLVFNPWGFILGAGRRNPIVDVVLGLGDDVSFCYGTRITATYGGPLAQITRAPRVTKIGKSISKEGMVASSGIWDQWMDALDEVDAKYARLNPRETTKVEAEDKGIARLIFLLSSMLCLTTLMIEMWIRYEYGNYDESSGHIGIKDSLDERLKDLEYAHRIIPRRLMAIIYHLEEAGTWASLATALGESTKSLLQKVFYLAQFAAAPIVVGKGAYVDITQDNIKQTIARSSKVILILAWVIVLVAIILACCAII